MFNIENNVILIYISVEIKSRSPSRAVTDWQSVPGRNSSQLLHGRDFLILFHHSYILKYILFYFILCQKTRNFLVFSSTHFSTFHKIKTRT